MKEKFPFMAAVMMLATGCKQFSQTAAKNYVNPFVGTTVLTNSADLGYVPPGAPGTV